MIDLDMNMNVPQMVMFSANQDVSEKWSVLGNVGWQNWSRFGKVDIGINSTDPRTLTIDNDYKDTWHAALGTQYRYTNAWTFSGGVAYDSSAVDSDKRSVTLPMGESWRFALGSQYAITPNLTCGLSYEYMWNGDLSVNQNHSPLSGTVSGEFNNDNFSIIALNLSWKY